MDLFRNVNTFHVVMWCLSMLACATALFIFVPHYQRLKRAPKSFFKKHVLKILLMVPVYSVTSLIALFFPRSTGLLGVLRSVVESRAIYAYVCMMLDLLGGFDRAAVNIQAISPQGKFYGVPPFGCCFRPCCPVVSMNRELVARCRTFAVQAVYAIPTLAYLHLWIELERATSRSEAYNVAVIVVQVLEVLTVMVAFYGMMILFFACRARIESYKPAKKMLSIKLVLFIGVVQSIVVSFVITETKSGSEGLFDESYTVTAWTNFLLCLESAPLAWLMRASYPERELYMAQEGDAPANTEVDDYDDDDEMEDGFVIAEAPQPVKKYGTIDYSVSTL